MENQVTEYVPIIETHNAGDRAFLRSILDAEGIVYFIQNEHVAPYLYNSLPMRVMVRKDQANKAREILKDVKLSYSYGFVESSQDTNDSEEG